MSAAHFITHVSVKSFQNLGPICIQAPLDLGGQLCGELIARKKKNPHILMSYKTVIIPKTIVLKPCILYNLNRQTY